MPRKKAETPAEQPEKALETPQEVVKAVVCSGRGLNLRVGPALSYEVTEVLPDGAGVMALDLPRGAEVPGWRLVFAASGAPAGEKTSWVQSRFLRLEH